jgi:hypothetical protein
VYPQPDKRLPARLSLHAVAPVPSTDPTRPGVPLWYFNVVAHDGRLEEQLKQQNMPEGDILERTVLFNMLGPDAFSLAAAAHHMALELGWRPLKRDPASAPDPSGTGWRPFSEARRRPRPNPPVPMDVVIQHLMTVRTKLFSGEVPGWLLAWDERHNPHQPCGLVYGMRGLAVGEPCGRPSGCVIAGGGACAWARQALTDKALARPARPVVASEHPIQPVDPAYAPVAAAPPAGLLQPGQPHYPRPQQPPHQRPQQPPYQQPPQGLPAPANHTWQPTRQGVPPQPTNGHGPGGIVWPAAAPQHPAHAAPVQPAPAAPPVVPPAVAPVAPPVAPPAPEFKPTQTANLFEPAPPLTWER